MSLYHSKHFPVQAGWKQHSLKQHFHCWEKCLCALAGALGNVAADESALPQEAPSCPAADRAASPPGFKATDDISSSTDGYSEPQTLLQIFIWSLVRSTNTLVSLWIPASFLQKKRAPSREPRWLTGCFKTFSLFCVTPDEAPSEVLRNTSVLGELAPVISPPTGAQDPNALLTVFGINTCDLWGETYFILLLTLASSLASHFHTALELLTNLVPSNS